MPCEYRSDGIGNYIVICTSPEDRWDTEIEEEEMARLKKK